MKRKSDVLPEYKRNEFLKKLTVNPELEKLQIDHYALFEDKLINRTDVSSYFNSNFYSFISKWSFSLINNFKNLCKQERIHFKIEKKCLNSFSNFFINFMNGISIDDCIGESISFIARQTKLPKIVIKNIFCNSDINLTDETIINNIIKKPLDKQTFERLKSKCINQKLVQQNINDLKIRYSIFDVANGNFWGFPPFIYLELLKPNAIENGYQIIEGFASPFNHNLDHYCSLYPEDKSDFGAMGSIFDILLNFKSNKPILWILNPPYTICVMNLLLDAVQIRNQNVPDDQYFFLLPDWKYSQLYQHINRFGLIKELINGNYLLYDYYNNKELLLPVNMTLGFLGNNTVNGNYLITFIEKLLDENQ